MGGFVDTLLVFKEGISWKVLTQSVLEELMHNMKHIISQMA